MLRAEEQIPEIVSYLKNTETWLKGLQQFVDSQIQSISEDSNYKTLKPEQEREFAQGIEELVKKYGLEHVVAAVKKRLELEWQNYKQEKIESYDANNRNVLDNELSKFFLRFRKPKDVKNPSEAFVYALGVTHPDAYTARDMSAQAPVKPFVGTLGGEPFVCENALREGEKQLQERGLRGGWDAVVNMLAHLSDPDAIDVADLSCQRVNSAQRLEDLIERFGENSLEKQLQVRVRRMVDELDGREEQESVGQCSPDLDDAISKLLSV
jgi:hypothetical protein